MPWNFPFWQVFRFAAPALMAGNAGLLKHASNVPQCALAIEEILCRAGFPEGAFQTLLIGSAQVARVIDDPRVAAVTLTGSEPAGAQVASQCRQADQEDGARIGRQRSVHRHAERRIWTKPCATAVKARIINNGQSCIAAKRFIVHESIYDEFERRFVDGMQRAEGRRSDGPQLPTSVRWPRAESPDELDDQVQRAVAGGARLLTGGQPIERPGNFYEPTVLADIPQELPGLLRRVFRTGGDAVPRDGIDEAIEIANDSDVRPGRRASGPTIAPSSERSSTEIEAGMVFVNGMVASDPRLPFGGVKNSGYGRELANSASASSCNVKTVWIK